MLIHAPGQKGGDSVKFIIAITGLWLVIHGAVKAENAHARFKYSNPPPGDDETRRNIALGFLGIAVGCILVLVMVAA